MERLTIQHDIDTAILHAQSPDQIATAALTRLHDLVPCQRASVAEIDPARQRYRDMVLLIDGQVQAQGSDWRSTTSIGPRLLRAMQQGETAVIKDITALETPSPLEQKLAEAGMRSYISVPLIVQNTPLGALNLACDTPDFFQLEYVDILEEIAASLTVALQQARLLKQTQQDAETKAMLLHEVNHRVMNNLTMILSLLELEIEQPRLVDDPTDLQAVLRDVHSRIYGIATVHRMLGELGKEEHGDLQDSLDLETLVFRVIEAALSASPHQQWVDVVVDAAERLPRLSAKRATTLALIINELTTNSAKYAFTDRAQGRIHVQITQVDDGEKVRLVFRDDGPGLPDDVLAGERQNVGLWLARTNATHTLDGRIEWYNDDGTVVEIQFPVR
jgi:two-component sensor histidine kinase